MSPQIATMVYVLGILGLFALDHDNDSRASKAVWIPVVWLWIIGSREVSQWLAVLGIGHAGTELNSPDRYLEDGGSVDRWVFTTLLVSGLVVLVRRGPAVVRLLRANLPILLFFLYCGLSVLWSDYPAIAFKRWFKALGDIVMVLIVLTDPDRIAAIKRLLARATFLLIPLSILFIKYYPGVGKGFKSYGLPIYVGVTTNKNLLGGICLIFGLASLWRFLAAFRDRESAHRTRCLVVHGALLAMVLWLFSEARSMTGLACFLLGSSLIAATSFRAVVRKPWVVHFLVAAVVLVSFSVLFFDVGVASLEALGKDPSLTGRTKIWDLVLSLSDNPLLGTGFESFWLGPRLEKIYSVYWWHPNEAHNGYIEVFLNLGWIGVALLAILIVKGYRSVVLGLRRDPDIGRLMLAYFVVEVVYNFTEAGFRMPGLTMDFFLMAMMALPKAPVPGAPVPGQYRDDTDGFAESASARRPRVLQRGLPVTGR
jgi:exopolysaccharide production protein ExoQ